VVYKIYLITFLSISLFGSNLDDISKKIYQNECGSNPKNLIHWNRGESFVSLGIGHFIWYHQKNQERFVESFPLFIKYLDNHKIKYPSWLSSHSPWSEAKDMKNDKKRVDELREFLLKTMNYQANFMKYRLDNSISKLSSLKKPYLALADSKNGYYILIDYLNFKGLGDNEKERYNGKGWGLLQVLECINDLDHVKKEFRKCAKSLLKQRVLNSPKNKNEEKWIKGWYNRINSYK
jgi:hypothetical protein